MVGSNDGAVRFYDFQYRLKAWFEGLKTKEITSISFANSPPRGSWENFDEESRK